MQSLHYNAESPFEETKCYFLLGATVFAPSIESNNACKLFLSPLLTEISLAQGANVPKNRARFQLWCPVLSTE